MVEMPKRVENSKIPISLFLDTNRRLIEANRQSRNDQITALVGPNPTSDDLIAAQNLVEEAFIADNYGWWKNLEDNIITFNPPYSDKTAMIGLSTENSDIFSLFNRAARLVAKPYQGFHQMGSQNTSGFTAWELYHFKGQKSYSIIEAVFEKMTQLAIE